MIYLYEYLLMNFDHLNIQTSQLNYQDPIGAPHRWMPVTRPGFENCVPPSKDPKEIGKSTMNKL